MNNLENENQKAASQKLQIWYCESCRCVHINKQQVFLDFSKKEFVELTDAIHGIFQEHFDPLEINFFSNMVSLSDDVLTGETVS